jgi:hypothetical protein
LTLDGRCCNVKYVDEIVFQVGVSEESGILIASWDDPSGNGGITTQGQDLRELQDQVEDAVRCHFDPGPNQPVKLERQ